MKEIGITDIVQISSVTPPHAAKHNLQAKYYTVQFKHKLTQKEWRHLTQHYVPVKQINSTTLEILFRTPTNNKNMMDDALAELQCILSIGLILDATTASIPRLCGYCGRTKNKT